MLNRANFSAASSDGGWQPPLQYFWSVGVSPLISSQTYWFYWFQAALKVPVNKGGPQQQRRHASSFSWRWLRVFLYELRVGDWVIFEFYRLECILMSLLFPQFACLLLLILRLLSFFLSAISADSQSWLILTEVWLVSPYKCSLLIKLKFCSLSVNPISLVLCIQALI